MRLTIFVLAMLVIGCRQSSGPSKAAPARQSQTEEAGNGDRSGKSSNLRNELILPHSGNKVAEITNSIGMKMVHIPAGKFIMGSPKGEKDRFEKEDQREIEIAECFWMGKFEVTQGEYQTLMENNPSRHTRSVNLPVEGVTWHEASEFCRRLSIREKKACSLPKETEWEYACRAGTKTPYFCGDTLAVHQANFCADFQCKSATTKPVGSFPANPWGLHDMNGNVFEWVEDFTTNLSPDFSRILPATCILRGGCFDYSAAFCRSAARVEREPTLRSHYVGFRVTMRESK